MNSSLITADSTTHLKILLVSLLAGIVVVWVGVGARVAAADTTSFDTRLGTVDFAARQTDASETHLSGVGVNGAMEFRAY
jgi:hypothetical protein